MRWLPLLFVAACGSPSLEELCTDVSSCFQYDSVEQCSANYFSEGCNDESAYLECMPGCTALACDGTLEACELTCYQTHCNPDALR